ncbi:class II aminotransferase/8-amino-7-oxononanoate synthase [Apiospora phragmitis]|uniref:Class II aminotransferase/8-amino-7-oxononanoate synthase n=1 Tax=Apiospora phragmitis TaxID=2905665 RepID=A0ABR1VVG3_9PEZI
MYYDTILKQWCEEHRMKGPSMRDEPAFYRNLERALDARRQSSTFVALKPRWDDTVADFTSADFLSLTRTGQIREAFLQELEEHPNFELGASGSRCQYGNYAYINQVEEEIADFHGAETAFITSSTYAANLGVLSSVPLPGDAIVYDELVHASSHEGFRLSLAEKKVAFSHNDPEGLREVLTRLKEEQPAFEAGTKSVLICVESIYSMEGDLCRLQELVQVAEEEFPLGNAQFIMDEAHSVGILGDKGRGLVSMLGLEKSIAIRIQAVSKAVGAVGGLIMTRKTVRSMIINNARSLTYSCAPSFPVAASMRAGYRLLMDGQAQKAQEQIQDNVRQLLELLSLSPEIEDARDQGILLIPHLDDDWTQRPVQTHIIPLVCTRPRHELFLFFHLLSHGFNSYPFAFPVVPKGQSRVRLVMHAHNTSEQITRLVAVIGDWTREVLDIESGESGKQLPTAALQLQAMQDSL